MNEIIISFIVIFICLFLLWIFGYINKKNKIKKLSEYSFINSPTKILNEEDHVTCFLCLRNHDFLSGQMNGMISLYNHKDFSNIFLIIEHCEPITSLSELNDGSILTSSADGTLKKIKLLINDDNSRNKNYLVEFVFYTYKEFIFKSIQIKNSDDIISSNIAKELILWKKTLNEIELYKVNKILLRDEYVQDILQVNDNILITSGESVQCWDINNYKPIKKLKYSTKGSSSIYKINEILTGIFLKNKGDILIFNNNDLHEVKIINLTKFSLTSLKSLTNKTILVGIFDEQNKKSSINQYMINIENNNSEEEKQIDFNNIEMIELKKETINYVEDDFYFEGLNWSRINTIEEIENYVILGIGGQEKMKNYGRLIIFEKSK